MTKNPQHVEPTCGSISSTELQLNTLSKKICNWLLITKITNLYTTKIWRYTVLTY